MFHLLKEKSWQRILQQEFQKPETLQLFEFIEKEFESQIVFPPKEQVFAALNLTSYENTRVVILGQDPYHGTGQAHGLAFSVSEYSKIPPSLRNIFKELNSDLQIKPPEQGSLLGWARQGVLLLNTSLTVLKGAPGSHSRVGWNLVTDAIIRALCLKKTPVVFLLWGNHAKGVAFPVVSSFEGVQRFCLFAAHPSPFSAHRGFFGCRHFSKTNELLKQTSQKFINWSCFI